MGECRHAAGLLWLEHAPSIGLAIGPRQKALHVYSRSSALISPYCSVIVGKKTGVMKLQLMKRFY